MVNQAAKWMAELQHPEGWLGVTRESSEATWPTSYAILLWSNLQGFPDESERGVAWLLEQKGETFTEAGIVGHDGTLEGWPWIAGTHSWLEPTAMAVMALRRSNHLHHPRTRQGVKLIVDRVIDGGGWNYGNTSVFGKTLRPQPAPTGLALLALANLEINRDTVTACCSYLRNALQRTRSPVSLSWGLLGLTAWDQRSVAAMKWLEESFYLVQEQGNSTMSMSLACLLLGASEESYKLLVKD